jgi:hypothetical protein
VSTLAPPQSDAPPATVGFAPDRMARVTLARAERQLQNTEQIALTCPSRAAVQAVRAARTALVAVLVSRGVHVSDGADTTLARTTRGLGLPDDAARAFTDLAVGAVREPAQGDASVAVAGARVVIAAVGSLITPALPA